MIWREQKSHVNDCYFCLVNVKRHSRNNKRLIQYPNLNSSLRPIPHSEQIRVPTFTHLPQIDDEYSASSSELSQDQLEDSKFQISDSSLIKRSPFNQLQLNDLVRDLYLPKQSAELPTSSLQAKNLLHPGTSVTFYRKREEEFLKYFTVEDGLVFCNDIHHLPLDLGLREYKPEEWRLFTDS